MKKDLFNKKLKKLQKLTEEDLMKCSKCGARSVPDKESLNFITKKWDGHTYKPNCKCMNKNIRFCVG